MKNSLALYGAGGHARVVYDSIARTDGLSLEYCLSDSQTDISNAFEHVVIEAAGKNRFKALVNAGTAIHLAIGDLKARQKIFREYEDIINYWSSVIDPTALISARAHIGAGCYIGARAIINLDTEIGENSIINTGVIVEHDNRIGSNVHLSPGTVTGGYVTIGQNSWIGIGATIKDRVSIGENSIIGAGSVIVKDIPSNVVAYGCPGTVKRELPS